MNDGNEVSGIAFGTLRLGNGDGAEKNVQAALDLGFVHVGAHLLIPMSDINTYGWILRQILR